MAAINNAQFFGQFLRAPTSDQLDTLRAFAKGLGYTPQDQFAQFPACIMEMGLSLPADPNNNTVVSLPLAIPFPVKCWGIDLGCVTAASTTATADVLRKVGVAAYASVFTAPKDIKTTAGATTRYAPEIGSELWDFGDLIELSVVSGSAAAVTGARGRCWVQMR